MEFTVVKGDIAAQSADALVNAAGTSLRMGSGVAGFSFEEGSRLVCEAVADYEASTLSDVRVIACGDDQFGLLQRVAAGVRE